MVLVCEQTKLLRSSGLIDEIDQIDDIITLEALNQMKQWKFPDITQCPLELCHREFGYRADAINHFKHRHAKNAFFCSKCDEPIEVYRPDDVQEHNRRAHQGENIASNFDVSSSGSKSLPFSSTSSSSSSSLAENVWYSDNYLD